MLCRGAAGGCEARASLAGHGGFDARARGAPVSSCMLSGMHSVCCRLWHITILSAWSYLMLAWANDDIERTYYLKHSM